MLTNFVNVAFFVGYKLIVKINFALVGVSSKFKHLKNVLLPEPLGPIMTIFSPCLIS